MFDGNDPNDRMLRSSFDHEQKPYGWNRFWSRAIDVKDGNLCCLFSSEIYSVARKEADYWKWCRTFNAKGLRWMFDTMALSPVFSFEDSAQLPIGL